jgi:alpha-galactosidase
MCPLAHGVSVTPAEMAEARRWVAAKFQGTPVAEESPAGLIVVANNDPVQLNGRAGAPLRIKDQEYRRGLYCHAVSKVVVRLPGPGKTFTAVVGVDTNSQTSSGRGSVNFSVNVAGKEAFRSELMREGMAGVPVNVDLAGAREFTLDVGDGGDGIACDQSDWADARVVLADGHEVWVGDLPIMGQARQPLTSEPPFSFVYDGKPSGELLKSWTLKRESSKLDEQRTQYTLTWTDPKTVLAVRCVGVAYNDFPTVEWTIHFKNGGATDSPMLEAIQAIDTTFSSSSQGDFTFRYHTGDLCTPDSYEPHADQMAARSEKKIANTGGRPTQSAFPYFNVGWQNEGVIVVLSWAGQWAAQFTRDDTNGMRIRAGQELTHFKLHAGEEVRGPMGVVQFYKGDWLRSQNVWRRWMLAHNLPRAGGKLPPSPQLAACSSHQFGEMINADTKSQMLFVDRYLEEGLKLDYWWMDAGWYPNKGGWGNTGTWEVDTKRFPNGLREISDHARAKGVRTIVWFEPERVTPGTWLYDTHSEWLFGRDGDQKLLNLGHPEALQWVTGHVDKLITEQGIDLYRQDYNIDPLPYWRAADAEDRQGISEIRYIEGYQKYWDELLRRHPNMFIDSCASGGRRNDLETLRRAVPLLRSDYIMEPVGNQAQTYALALWVPFYGTGTSAIDAYMFRSVMCPHFTACFDMRRKDLNYEEARRLVGQWRKVAPCFYGDYYPLTPYSFKGDAWIGWQFDRSEAGDGFIQAFRRAGSVYRVADLKLQGLDPEKKYEVTDLDTEKTSVVQGKVLMESGVTVEIASSPGAALLSYKVASK